MNLPSSQLNVRWKAVWGSKRKFGGALLSFFLTFTGFTATAIADGRHGRSGHKAEPGVRNASVKGYKIDDELTRRSKRNPTQTTRVIVTLQPGAQLPTVRQLAVDLHVNANTVARVYAALERTEVVETQRGVGTFVRATPPAVVIEHRERELERIISRFIPEFAALGFTIEDVIKHLQRRTKQEKEIHAPDRQ